MKSSSLVELCTVKGTSSSKCGRRAKFEPAIEDAETSNKVGKIQAINLGGCT